MSQQDQPSMFPKPSAPFQSIKDTGTGNTPSPPSSDNTLPRLASNLLEQASKIVGARSETHGDIEQGFRLTSQMWANYLGTHVTTVDVAHMLLLYKMSRAKFGDQTHMDHFIDEAGYAGIAGALSGKRG